MQQVGNIMPCRRRSPFSVSWQVCWKNLTIKQNFDINQKKVLAFRLYVTAQRVTHVWQPYTARLKRGCKQRNILFTMNFSQKHTLNRLKQSSIFTRLMRDAYLGRWSAAVSRATVSRYIPMWDISSLFCLSLGFMIDMRNLNSSRIDGRPYGTMGPGTKYEI